MPSEVGEINKGSRDFGVRLPHVALSETVLPGTRVG